MSTKPISHTVRLGDEELEALERKLTIAALRLPGSQFGVWRSAEGGYSEVRDDKELRATQAEIIENYRQGVKIASQAESRPLIPLFKAANQKLPPEIKVDYEEMKYDFYNVKVTFSSLLPEEQFPVFSELKIQISDDVKDSIRSTRPIRLFPGHKDRQLFSLDFEGAIGIDAGLDFSTLKAGGELIPFTQAKVDAKVKTGIIFGPLQFHFRKAAVEVQGESDQNISWRYNYQSEFTGTNDFKSLLILKVAREASDVKMSVSLGIVPCKRKWLIFKDYLAELSDHVVLPVELSK